MEAVFVTERIILLSAGEEVSDGAYRQAIKVISTQLLHDYSAQHYLIINVSEPRSDLIRLNSNVMDYGWPANVAPPLERLCAICKQADVFFNTHPRNTLIIHCKGGLGRAALVVASYMHYTSICAVSSQALDRYAMKHFFDENLRRHILPSQRRYVQYFSGLLDGSIAIRNEPVYLCGITLVQVANFDGRAGCRPFFKIYQAMEHVWTSEVYSLSESEGRRVLSIHLQPALQLRGDIMIKCYHHRKLRPDLRDTIFRYQLHTCAVQGTVILYKSDLDEADHDIRFPEDGRLELDFRRSADEHPPSQEADHQSNTGHNPASRQTSAHLGESASFSSSEPAAETFPIWPDLVPSSDRGIIGHSTSSTDTVDGGTRYSPQRPTLLPSSPADDHVVSSHDSADYWARPAARQPPSSAYAKVTRKPVDLHYQATEREDPQLSSRDSHHSSGEAVTSGRMETSTRRSQSPGGTLKSVKFRDLPETKESLELEQAAATLDRLTPTIDSQQRPAPLTNGYHLRSGMDVVDLDAMQPDFDELDRAFGSLQSESESVEGANESRPVTAAFRRQESRESTGGSRGERRRGSYGTSGPSPTPPSPVPESSLISGYVPHDRKGLAKKFGAFTFGLPTSKPELKPVDHSPDPQRRRSSGDHLPNYSSDYEATSQDEAVQQARDRLRPVPQPSSGSSRRKAEQVLYNSAADAAMSPKLRDVSPYGVISSSNVRPAREAMKERSLSREGAITPPPPRPRTPTQEERLQRLLKPDEREFVVVEEDRHRYRLKSPLKEIAKPANHHSQPGVYEDMRMESESGMSEGEDWPLPERKKKKSQVRHLPPHNADDWLATQHDKLQHRKYGPAYQHRQHQEQAMLEELRETHQRMQQQVPNRDIDENRLPLSSIVLREAKTPPLTRRPGSGNWSDEEGVRVKENPGYAVVRSQLTPSSFQISHSEPVAGLQAPQQPLPPQPQHRFETNEATSRRQAFQMTPVDVGQISGHPVARTSKQMDHPVRQASSSQRFINQPMAKDDTDHDSIIDEVDFSDEPLYKVVPQLSTSRSSQQRTSRSRQIDEGRLASGGEGGSPDLLRKSAVSPKSILKNSSLTRVHRNAVSEERPPTQHTANTRPIAQRPITPNFPVSETLPTSQDGTASSAHQNRQQMSGRPEASTGRGTTDQSGRSTPTGYVGVTNGRRASLNSVNVEEDEGAHRRMDEPPLFVRDVSKYWYKPSISREEAIQILKSKPAGTFLIRDSHSFPGAFGLAVKVDAQHLQPNNSNASSTSGNAEDLVRHFLIESSAKGVHLKGSPNEPVFTSLSALVYQHSLTPLALPCRLTLPQHDLAVAEQPLYSEDSLQRLMEQGAACNVFYLLSLDTESLTGPQAIRRAMTHIHHGHAIHPTVVHFKVNENGVLLTDNQRKLFFRRNYPIQSISYCGMDPDDRRWTFQPNESSPPISARCFGFVTRKAGSANQNECLIFAELEAQQPAGAVVSFVTKVIRTANSSNDVAPSGSTFRSRQAGNYAGLMRSQSYRYNPSLGR